MRTGGLANGGVQGAGQLGQVVQIVGGAADVQRGAFVRQGMAYRRGWGVGAHLSSPPD